MSRLFQSILVIGVLAVSVGLAISSRAPKEPAAPGEIPILVSPSTVSLGSQGTWVTVHAEIPASVVAGFTVQLNGVPVEVVKADSQGELVAKFPLDSVKSIIAPPRAELVLTGKTVAGDDFVGRATVGVTAAKR